MRKITVATAGVLVVFFSIVTAWWITRGHRDVRRVTRVSFPHSAQVQIIQYEWTDPTFTLTAAERDSLLEAPIVAGDFCKKHLEGCATFVSQFTEMLTEDNPLATTLLECRLAYETSNSNKICDAGRRMIVQRISKEEGRVVFIGFEPGRSNEEECVILQQCLRDSFAGAVFRWPEGSADAVLVYAQAPWVPGGYHPSSKGVSHHERYVRLLEHAQEGVAFDKELLRRVALSQLSPDERFELDYRMITNRAKEHDAEVMLRAIISRTDTL